MTWIGPEMIQPKENSGVTWNIQVYPSPTGFDVPLWDFLDMVLMSK